MNMRQQKIFPFLKYLDFGKVYLQLHKGNKNLCVMWKDKITIYRRSFISKAHVTVETI